MKITPIYRAGTAAQLQPRCTCRRKKPYGPHEDPNNLPKCSAFASFVVDGVGMCAKHASIAALEFLVKQTEQTP